MDHVFLMSISPGLPVDICGHATWVQYLNILLVNHVDVCGCLKQVQYLSVRLGPLLDTVHTICPNFTTKVKHFQLTSRHIWAGFTLCRGSFVFVIVMCHSSSCHQIMWESKHRHRLTGQKKICNSSILKRSQDLRHYFCVLVIKLDDDGVISVKSDRTF